MPLFTVYDINTGEILRSGVSDPAAFLAQKSSAGEGILMEIGNSSEQYVDLNLHTLIARPSFVLPYAVSLTINQDWSIPGVPAGAMVEIDGADAGVTDGAGLILSFPRAGVWRIRLVPPFPWIERSCEVTVA